MIESNYTTLRYYKLSKTETQKRADFLAQSIEQLTQYHLKASKKKQPIIDKLIAAYSDLLETIKQKLGE